jgi:hypothetical protein
MQTFCISANQPGDSGVGASVESASNHYSVRANASRNTLQEMKKRDAVYSSRMFSNSFHDFVGQCSALDASARPSVGQVRLFKYPFFQWIIID